MKKLNKTILNIVAFFAAAVFSVTFIGCQILDIGPREKIIIEAATKSGVAKYIDGDAEKATRVLEVIEPAKAAIAGGELNVVVIKDLVRQEIDFEQLSPEDEILVDALIEYIALELQDYTAGQINEDALVQLEEVFTWVEEVASAYQPANEDTQEPVTIKQTWQWHDKEAYYFGVVTTEAVPIELLEKTL